MPPIVKGWSHMLTAAITAHSCLHSLTGCSGGSFQHGEVAEERVCQPSMRQEVRHSGNGGRGCNGFICLRSLFLNVSLSPVQHLQVAFSLIHRCDFNELIKPSSVSKFCLPRYVSWVREPSDQREKSADGVALHSVLPPGSPLPLPIIPSNRDLSYSRVRPQPNVSIHLPQPP